MPPDCPEQRLGLPRSHVVEVIERSQEDAVRTLRAAGLPEVRIQAVTRRIETACLTVLTEQDALIKELLAFGEQPRTPEHAKLMQSRIGWHMEQVDKTFMAIAVIEIQKTLDAYQQAFEPAGQVIEAPYREPWPPEWLATLLRVANAITRGMLWFCAVCVLTLLVWAQSGSLVWLGLTVGLSLIFWLFSWGHWWSVLFPIGAIGILVVIIM
jgi:hypothetical protein